jgi:hypothetical protein
LGGREGVNGGREVILVGLKGGCGTGYGGEGGRVGEDCVEVCNWVIVNYKELVFSFIANKRDIEFKVSRLTGI